MKIKTSIITALCLALMLSGCAGNNDSPAETSETTAAETTVQASDKTASETAVSEETTAPETKFTTSNKPSENTCPIEGQWVMSGAEDGAHFTVDSKWNYTAYYDGGAVESQGTVAFDGDTYTFSDENGEFASFCLSSPTRLSMNSRLNISYLRMDNVMMGIRDICGTWYEDGNAENNTLTLYSNGDWEYTAPDGTVTAEGTFNIISGDPSDIAVELTADKAAADVYLNDSILSASIFDDTLGGKREAQFTREFDESSVDVPVLMNGVRYTGMTPERNDSGYKGGYFYADKTQDGATVVSNVCINTAELTGNNDDELMLAAAKDISGSECEGYTAALDDTLTAHLGYDTYIAKFNANGSDWYMMMFSAYNNIYAYSYAVQSDFSDGMYDVFYSDAQMTELSEPTAVG